MSDSDDDLDAQEPLFTHAEPELRFGRKDVAYTLFDLGVPWATGTARADLYQRKRFIHVREKGRPGIGSQFAPLDLAAATILSAIQDSGVQDHEVLQEASTALYSWGDAQFAQRMRGHPVAWALRTTAEGHEWVFRIDFWRDLEGGRRIIDPRLYPTGGEAPGSKVIPPSAHPVCSLVVTTTQLFQPVLRRLREPQGH